MTSESKVSRRSWRKHEKDDNNQSSLVATKQSLPNCSSRQEGLPPQSFYRKTQISLRRTRHLNNMLTKAADTVIRQQRKEVSLQHKLKRAAYKDVTSLKTWPLQELAIQDYNYWCQIHLGSDNPTTNATKVKDISSADISSSSSSLSSSSLEETKRIRRKDSDDEKEFLSPRKSTLRYNFQQQFLQEREVSSFASHPNDDDDEDAIRPLPALWCMEPRIFAIEKAATGKRKYIVGHLGRILDYYWRKCDPKQRHYYELIREDTPCRLYLDLEFSKIFNPDITDDIGEVLLQELADELITEFSQVHSIKLTRDSIIDLDSSTDVKFSHHWIIHLPNGGLFADAAAAGRFVRVFVGRLAEEIATGQLARPVLSKYLFVANEPQQRQPQEHTTNVSVDEEDLRSKTCFIDLGVYTRNRLFRILGSSKFGKSASAALRLASRNTFPLSIQNENFYIPAMTNKLEMFGKDDDTMMGHDLKYQLNQFQSSIDWIDHAEALAATLVVPMNFMKSSFPILVESNHAMALKDGDVGILSTVTKNTRGKGPIGKMRNTTNQTGKSPFPFLDDFVIHTLSCRGGVQGEIRCWTMDVHQNLPISITYQIQKNRWCEAIGRPHKSNGIMWIIDFERMEFRQSCFDVECRTQRPKCQSKPLSMSLQQQLSDSLFEMELMLRTEEAEGKLILENYNDSDPQESITILEKKSPTNQNEFDDDDDEFEKALVALTLDDSPSAVTSAEILT